MRVIADHIKAATFLASEGIVPSNKEQGYVMRRLVRRAILFAFNLGVEQNFMETIINVVADLYQDDYPEISQQKSSCIDILVKEEKIFRQTLRKGLQEFDRIYRKNSDHNSVLTGDNIFKLHDTYGFPLELSLEEAFKRNLTLAENWQNIFDQKMAEQRQRSQTASKGIFKGGLGGHTLQHKKYHTATHLMYEALRQVLGDHVVQHGSNITEERLRFDFSHPQKMTPEEINKVEEIVNQQIDEDLIVTFEEYDTEYAIKTLGALGAFGDRYGEKVKIYSMQSKKAKKPFSFEICGGPHVDHTLQLKDDQKVFKILKEESSSAGIRRIKAALI